jgi:hypothetical protein
MIPIMGCGMMLIRMVLSNSHRSALHAPP